MLLHFFSLFDFKLRERLGIPLGERPPTLVPVSHVMMCMNCGCDFTLTLRRHHCHACGKVRAVPASQGGFIHTSRTLAATAVTLQTCSNIKTTI